MIKIKKIMRIDILGIYFNDTIYLKISAFFKNLECKKIELYKQIESKIFIKCLVG